METPLAALGPPWLIRLALLFGYWLLEETNPCDEVRSAIYYPAVICCLLKILSLELLAVLFAWEETPFVPAEFGTKLLPVV